MTLLAVPPGQQPTNMTPIAKSGGNVKIWQIPQANKGIIVYWASTPIQISFGCLRILHKSSNLIVSHMPNIEMPSKNGVYAMAQEKYEGTI